MLSTKLAACALALLFGLHSGAYAATPEPPVLKVGQCVTARIASVASRLENEPDSGTYVTLTNGITSISYDTVAAASNARVGDEVIACLVSIPENCPPNDDRGKVYTVMDLRTKGSWTLPNDEHSCGGA